MSRTLKYIHVAYMKPPRCENTNTKWFIVIRSFVH